MIKLGQIGFAQGETALLDEAEDHEALALQAYSHDNHKEALDHFDKAQRVYPESRRLATLIAEYADHTKILSHDRLLIVDYYLLAAHANRTLDETRSHDALNKALAVLQPLSESRLYKRNDREHVAQRTLGIMVRAGQETDGLILRGKAMAILNTQIHSMLSADDASGTTHTAAFISRMMTAQGADKLDSISLAVITGHFTNAQERYRLRDARARGAIEPDVPRLN